MQNPHFDPKIKIPKTCQNPFYKSFRVVLCKNRSKKHQIFEKWDHFENRPLCKGYSPCKILTVFFQKLKFQKTCQNPFYKSFRVVLREKPLQKKHQLIEKWDHFENRPSCKGYSPCKIFTLAQKLKFQKHVKIHSTNHLELFCAKTARKNAKYSRNGTILGYSLCKMASLGQKFKSPQTC